jgi:hypothetical protein
MWRSIYIAAIAYGCGAPGWDGYRPVTLDRPLQAFYRQVNAAADQGRSLLVAANAARSAYVRAYVARVEKQFHVSKEATLTVGGGEGAGGSAVP